MISIEEHQAWDVLMASLGQLRLAPSGHVVGLDMTAALKIMEARGYPIHVGVWLDVDSGGVLHCSQEAGVAFQSLTSLALNGWRTEGFYRFTG